MRLSLLLISIAIMLAITVSASGIADAVWSAGTSRFGQVLAQNEQTSKIMEYYQAAQNPDGYLEHLAQSTLCEQRENQQACSTFQTIQGLTSGGASSLITTFCSLQTNQQSEICKGYSKGLETFGQFSNTQNMFSNPGRAAQTYAMGEMTKHVSPEIGKGIQTVTAIQGQLNSLQLASSGNSDQLLRTALNYGVARASGERPSLQQLTGQVTHDTESTIQESFLRSRQCVVSFNLDGSIQDINACKTTRETDISILMHSSKQVLTGPDCNIFKKENELSVIATENTRESGCYVTIIDREHPENKITYKRFIPREVMINDDMLRSGYFLFRQGELAKAIMLSSRNDNEIILNDNKIIIGKGVLVIYENNENKLYYDYVQEYRGSSVTRLQARNGDTWEDIGTLNPGLDTRIRQLENGVEIAGEGFNVNLEQGQLIVNNGRVQIIPSSGINIMQNTEANLLTQNGGAYIETQDSQVLIKECSGAYPVNGNIINLCERENNLFFARGSGFTTGPIKQVRVSGRTTLSEFSRQHNVPYQTLCKLNNIQNCNGNVELQQNSKILLPDALYQIGNQGTITRTETVRESGPTRDVITPDYGRITLNPETQCGQDDNCVFMRDESQDPRGLNSIEILVLHITQGRSAIDSHNTLGPTGSASRLSVHYILDRPGNYIQEVNEQYATRHVEDIINRKSIGIEIANSGDLCRNICGRTNSQYCSSEDCTPVSNGQYEKFSQTQMKALVRLASEILIRNNLDISDIRQHGRIYQNLPCAPRGFSSQRYDPGPLFNWCKFNRNIQSALNQYENKVVTETATGDVTKEYNGFRIQNMERMILSQSKISTPNIASITNFQDSKIIAMNSEDGTCLSRTEDCGIGSVTIKSGPGEPISV